MTICLWMPSDGCGSAGLTVEDLTPAGGTDAGVDAILDVTVGDRSARFAVQAKCRAPYPHELERLQRSWHGLAARGHPLIVAPFISEPLGSILTRDGWSWADAQGNFDLRAPGLLLRQRRTSTPPAPKRKISAARLWQLCRHPRARRL